MGAGISFAKVESSGAELVESLARAIWPVVYREIISPDQIDYMLARMYRPATIREEIQEKGICYILINLDDKAVGFTAFGPLRENEFCFLHKIYVKPELQGKGLGSQALVEVEKQIRAGHGIGVELRVNRQNESAISFYHKHGMEIVKEDCADIGGGFVMDDYVFRKEWESD